MKYTHEQFIAEVSHIAWARLNDEERAKLARVKIVYGTGAAMGARGVTFYGTWQNGHEQPVETVEICAFGEESTVQVAGTTLHEFGHVLAGLGVGHGPGWKEACSRIGLRCIRAAGTNYIWSMFTPDIRAAIVALGAPTDGAPLRAGARTRTGKPMKGPRPCAAGVGTRGGKSRGVGSGSRMRKVSCAACGYIARVTTKWLDSAGAPLCPCNSERMVVA